MEIKIKIEASVIIQEGETNFNEILHAAKEFSKQIGRDFVKNITEIYTQEIAKLLCKGKGQSHWVKHEHKDEKNGQLCLGGSYNLDGFRKKERIFKTEIGDINIKVLQMKCNVCGKRFAVILPLLDIPEKSRVTVKVKQMVSETVTDLSYRKSSLRFKNMTEVMLSKSAMHRLMTEDNWSVLTDERHSEENWESLSGIMADGTGYKRQGAETTKGDLRVVMGVTKNPRKLIPLGVWANKTWKEIDEEILKKKPKDLKAPVLTIDGERGEQVLGNLAEDIQRCTWHASRQMGYFLWHDGVKKPQREELIKKLSGLIKIQLPKGDYKEISADTKNEIIAEMNESKKSIEKLIRCFKKKGYNGAAKYLENAAGHLFTVIEKWLELGYMPPRVISLLERVMREMARRIKNIGASWKDKGVLAISHVLLTRLYCPEQWKSLWERLLDLNNRCKVKDYHISFSVVSV